jgi:hypothetical protein
MHHQMCSFSGGVRGGHFFQGGTDLIFGFACGQCTGLAKVLHTIILRWYPVFFRKDARPEPESRSFS